MRLLAVVGLLWATAWARGAETWTMMNPTGLAYDNELVRIKVDVPNDISRETYAVTEDGREVPWQIEEINGRKHIWVAADLARGQTHEYRLRKGRSAQTKPRVNVEKRGEWWTLDNGLLGVRVPAGKNETGGKAAPIGQVRLPDGQWVGRGFWKTERKVTNCTVRVIGDGTVFGKVRVRWEYEGKGGLLDGTPAFYQADITLGPGRNHAVVEESFAMGRRDYWEIDIAHGWDARGALMRGLGAHLGANFRGTLEVGQTRMRDTLINLIPRWSQAFDDDPHFAVTNAAFAVGGMACRAGRWLWPHDGMIEAKVKESADYAGLRCPTWRGKRYWYLLAGRRDVWPDYRALEAYASRHAVYGLDKLHQEYILDWPGLKPPPATTNLTPEQVAAWGSGAGRFCLRNRPYAGWGPSDARWEAEDHPIKTLTRIQDQFDPDTYGTHWLYYSPENPNFFSHWVNGMFSGLSKLKAHPQFDAIRLLAEQKALEESYFGVTMPGGAGQECFGYMARGSWANRLRQCLELGCRHTGELRRRNEAAASYIFKTSYPLASGVRRMNTGGDTHPPGGDVFAGAVSSGLPTDATALASEEFPGFGAVLRNRPGTPIETYFSFKSGPNRGHFHGDQLAFHYCAYGRPVAVDHHCSYAPRAGQEHMHNRLAFFTRDVPYANMDGYERLIAFKTSEHVDAAIGQVESERLRRKRRYPPEEWDNRLAQVRFESPLLYRRTAVLVKAPSADDAFAGRGDYLVLRDQYRADRPLGVAYCLHVNAPGTLVMEVKEEGGGEADGRTAAFTDPRFDFVRARVPAGTTLVLDRGEARTRHSVTSVVGRTLHLSDAPAEGKGIPYRVLDAEGATLIARPARYATVGGDGAFRDSQGGFARAGVQAGWQVLVDADGEQCMTIREVEDQALRFDTPLPAGHYLRYRILKTLGRVEPGRIVFDNMTLHRVQPERTRHVPFPWTHRNGGLEETQGVRLEVEGESGEFVTVLMPHPVRKADVARLTLVNAIRRDERQDRAPEPAWKEYDLLALLTWDDGKLMGEAVFLTPEMINHLSIVGTVEGAEGNGELRLKLAADLRIRGFEGRIEYAVRARRDGNDLTGTYDGSLLLGRGAPEKREGAVRGQWTRNVLPPLNLYAGAGLPAVTAIPGGVRVGDDEIVFAGGLDEIGELAYVTVRRGSKPILTLTGKDLDTDRCHGDIGLFVPDAGYPFGVIPDWLIRQRGKTPDWYQESWPPTRSPAAP